MNILFVSAVMPYPLYSGGQVRIYNILKLLSKKHTITLFCFIRNKQEESFSSNLDFCTSVSCYMRGSVWQPRYLLKSIFGRYPLLYASYDLSDIEKAAINAIHFGSIDVIHAEPSYVWPSLPQTRIPIVVSEHNVEYRIYDRYVSYFPLPVLRPILTYDVAKHEFWEKHVWKNASSVTAVSESDASTIQLSGTKTPVTVVPNGVDVQRYVYKARTMDTRKPICLYVGDFTWLQNRDAIGYICDYLWNPIITKHPTAILRVVGRNIPSGLKKKLIAINAQIAEDIADIRQEYYRAHVLLAPIRIGGGTKYKILEAMATGLPVITSEVGIEGLPFQHDKHVLIAQSTGDYVNALAKYTGNVPFAQAVTHNARKIIEKRYSWERIAGKLDGVWQEAYEQRF